jgi:hypothetical protein
MTHGVAYYIGLLKLEFLMCTVRFYTNEVRLLGDIRSLHEEHKQSIIANLDVGKVFRSCWSFR